MKYVQTNETGEEIKPDFDKYDLSEDLNELKILLPFIIEKEGKAPFLTKLFVNGN